MTQGQLHYWKPTSQPVIMKAFTGTQLAGTTTSQIVSFQEGLVCLMTLQNSPAYFFFCGFLFPQGKLATGPWRQRGQKEPGGLVGCITKYLQSDSFRKTALLHCSKGKVYKGLGVRKGWLVMILSNYHTNYHTTRKVEWELHVESCSNFRKLCAGSSFR